MLLRMVMLVALVVRRVIISQVNHGRRTPVTLVLDPPVWNVDGRAVPSGGGQNGALVGSGGSGGRVEEGRTRQVLAAAGLVRADSEQKTAGERHQYDDVIEAHAGDVNPVDCHDLLADAEQTVLLDDRARRDTRYEHPVQSVDAISFINRVQ